MKIILIDGLPASGKSTSAGIVATTLGETRRSPRTFLETDHNHPLHIAEVDAQGAVFADAHLRFTAQQFADLALGRWRTLEIPNEEVWVMESFPIQSHIRVLMQMDASTDLIDMFWEDLQRALAWHDPLLIVLETTAPEDLVRHAVETRGPAWAHYAISSLESTPYARNRNLVGIDGISAMMVAYADLFDRLTGSWQFKKATFPAQPSDYPFRDEAIRKAVLALA